MPPPAAEVIREPGVGALPGRATSAPEQPTLCAPIVSHTWAATRQIAAGGTSSSSVTMRYTCGAGLNRRTRSTLNDLSNQPSMPACFSGLSCGSGGEFVSVVRRKPASFNRFSPVGTSGCAGIVSMRCRNSSMSASRIDTPWIEPSIFSTPCPNAKKVV